MLHEPEYFARNMFEYRTKQAIIKAKTVPKKTMYKVNKREVRARLINFLGTSKGATELFFYTISFPPCVNYSVAYKLLNSTLTSIRQAHKGYNYLWIAERQKNGTIHYHIASFKYIKVTVINNVVKKYLKNEIRIGNLNWNLHSCNRYNGVDIAKDRVTRIPVNFALKKKSSAIAKYLTKYITKTKEKFPRKAWSCSNDISIIATSVRITTSEAVAIFDEHINWQNCIFMNEFCEFYPWIKDAPDIVSKVIADENNKRLTTVLQSQCS